METRDLFPSELATARAEHERLNGGDVCPPDSRCTVCYSADEIADAESFDEAHAADDKREVDTTIEDALQEYDL